MGVFGGEKTFSMAHFNTLIKLVTFVYCTCQVADNVRQPIYFPCPSKSIGRLLLIPLGMHVRQPILSCQVADWVADRLAGQESQLWL